MCVCVCVCVRVCVLSARARGGEGGYHREEVVSFFTDEKSNLDTMTSLPLFPGSDLRTVQAHKHVGGRREGLAVQSPETSTDQQNSLCV